MSARSQRRKQRSTQTNTNGTKHEISAASQTPSVTPVSAGSAHYITDKKSTSGFNISVIIALSALILALGQYYQNGLATRTNIATLWNEGWTDETRTRVTKFRTNSKNWRAKNGEQSVLNSLDLLMNAASGEPQTARDILKDENLSMLIASDLQQERQKLRDAKLDRELTDEEVVQVALRYRNSIINTLNTIEVIQAVIQTKPLWFRFRIFDSDALEYRYSDTIRELTTDLTPFIERYRATTHGRTTPTWYILTKPSPKFNENTSLYIALLIILALVGRYVFRRRSVNRTIAAMRTYNLFDQK